MFRSKVGTNDSRLFQESNLTARHPRRAPHHDVIQDVTIIEFDFFCPSHLLSKPRVKDLTKVLRGG